ncbi:MAG TPA: NAD(P)-dependent oxidoreductase [Verrucomicrobiales bacterium]|nr:NAD(P)-dependent oxidoreductase [Verrucomicrobiales bacterium]
MPGKPHSLIVGGTRGIGRVLAEHFVKAGHRVSVIGRRSPEKKFPRGIRFWPADLLDAAKLRQTLTALIKRDGRLNSLICLQRFKSEGDQWEGEIATSLTATRQIIEQLSSQFVPGENNSIVLVSSAASNVIASEQGPGYHVAKAGLNQMARYYAVVLGPQGIRVNVVSPGTVLKPENRDFYLGNEKLQRLFKKTVPLGRMGTAAEIAEVIDFLSSAKASFITGQTLLVDGGVNLLSTETLARSLAG